MLIFRWEWISHRHSLSFLWKKVIGLNKNGYGRILSECNYTAKLLYCLWVTLAEEDDNFIIETTKPLPEKWTNLSQEQQKRLIKDRIIGKSNEELAKVNETHEKFLRLWND